MLRYFQLIFNIVENDATFAENVAICLFLSSINLMGYFLEIHFIKMGEVVLSQPKPAQIKVEVKKMGWTNQWRKNLSKLRGWYIPPVDYGQILYGPVQVGEVL